MDFLLLDLSISMGFIDKQNEYYVSASIRLIRKQILKLMKDIPVVELQNLDDQKNDMEMTRKILQHHLTEAEFYEYSVWAWLISKIPEIEH